MGFGSVRAIPTPPRRITTGAGEAGSPRQELAIGRLPTGQLIVSQDGADEAIGCRRPAGRGKAAELAMPRQGTSCDRPVSSPSERRLADVERRLATEARTGTGPRQGGTRQARPADRDRSDRRR